MTTARLYLVMTHWAKPHSRRFNWHTYLPIVAMLALVYLYWYALYFGVVLMAAIVCCVYGPARGARQAAQWARRQHAAV